MGQQSRDNHTAQQLIARLESFFSLVDSGALFDLNDGPLLRQLRAELREALGQLLVWKRPELEAARSILWPYEGFQKRYRVFHERATSGTDAFWRYQGQMFLAFLPFPQQWSWLLEVERRYGDDSEVLGLLQLERQKIAQKFFSKPQKSYKLRHFCQVLKSSRGPRAKGLLRIFALPYLLVLYPDLLSRFSARYVLLVEPPMGAVFRHAWWRRFAALEDPCLVGIGSEEDAAFLRHQARLEPIPLAHGDYLCEQVEVAPGAQREYDVVFNASFDDMPRKRHELMLELLRHPLLLHTKVLFLGRGAQNNIDEWLLRVEQLGLKDRVTVLANIRRQDVPDYLGRCKIGVHLSLYENACRSIYEFFRSDLPCVISSSMAGMNLALFNSQTGMAVADRDLPQAIAWTLANRAVFQPRSWFLHNSGSIHSTRKLNEIVKGLFQTWGYEWGEDIPPMGSSGAKRHIRPADYERFRDDLQWMLRTFQSVGDLSTIFSND